MATVAYKQGTILERFWTALRLRRSKGSREASNLMKFRSGGLKREWTDEYEDRGALRGTPGSAYPQPEPNATELPSSAPGRPQASAPSPTQTRAEEHIATTPD